jgi:hypothetical protein
MNDPTEVMARLAQAVATSSIEAPLSLRMCLACLGILGVDGGTFTLAYADPARVMLCATDERSAQLEDLQEVVGEGPSYAAYDERSMQTLIVDGDPDQRWPLFSEAVKRLMHSCTLYAVPIKPGPQTMGVATFYQRRTSPLRVDAPTSQLLINAVGVALVTDPDVLDDRYAKAESWHGRARINQATGMVMAQLRISAADGLALLRAHAYAHSQTLSAVSDDLIGRRLDFRTADEDPESAQS